MCPCGKIEYDYNYMKSHDTANYTLHEKEYAAYSTHRRTVLKKRPTATYRYTRYIYCLLYEGVLYIYEFISITTTPVYNVYIWQLFI